MSELEQENLHSALQEEEKGEADKAVTISSEKDSADEDGLALSAEDSQEKRDKGDDIDKAPAEEEDGDGKGTELDSDKSESEPVEEPSLSSDHQEDVGDTQPVVVARNMDDQATVLKAEEAEETINPDDTTQGTELKEDEVEELSVETTKPEDLPIDGKSGMSLEAPCEDSSEPAHEKPADAPQGDEVVVKVECVDEDEEIANTSAQDTSVKTESGDEESGEIEVIAADTIKPKKKKRRPHLHIGRRAHKKYYPSKHMIRLEVVKTPKNKSKKCLDIAVYLIEKTGRLLTVEEGVGFTAGHVLDQMIDNLSLPHEASRVFSIWLSSPFLELQLKPHHKPCELRRQWPHLLTRFTTATEEQISRDEPILSFQRNVFYTVAEEMKLSEDGIIKRLFEEAKYNILTCQYPVSQEDAEMLGGILVYLEHGAYDEEKHSTTDFLNHNLRQFLPPYTWKSRWPFVTYWTKRQENQRLLEAYKEVSPKLSTLKSCHLAFLQFCWTLPYYGSVFFHGQVEQEATGYWHTLLGHPDIPVLVALNSEGIHIIEDSSNEILLGLTYDDFSWDYVACDEQDPDCLDTLCLEYDEDDPEHDGHKISTQLSIFSKEAIMMDAMIQTCTSCHKAGILPSADGAFKRSHSKRMESVSVTAYTDGGEPFVRSKPTNFSLSKPLRRLRRFSGSDQDGQ